MVFYKSHAVLLLLNDLKIPCFYGWFFLGVPYLSLLVVIAPDHTYPFYTPNNSEN